MKNLATAIIIGAFFNENAAKNKVTIITSSDPINKLNSTNDLTPEAMMRIAASGNQIESKNVRGLYPVNEKVAEKVMNVQSLSKDPKNPTIFQTPISGLDLFGFEIANRVVETTTLREGSNPEKVRKVNPSTGEIQTSNGSHIYRYVDVIPAISFTDHELIVSDQTAARMMNRSQN